MIPQSTTRALVRTGLAAGAAAVVMYLARTFLPLPDAVSVAFFIYFGAVLVVAFVGFFPFIARPVVTVPAILGTVFGVLAGLANTMFAVIQMTNLHYIFGYMRAAQDEAAREAWQSILNGVFTVQNGMNWVGDLFLDLAAFMYAMVMWRHRGWTDEVAEG